MGGVASAGTMVREGGAAVGGVASAGSTGREGGGAAVGGVASAGTTVREGGREVKHLTIVPIGSTCTVTAESVCRDGTDICNTQTVHVAWKNLPKTQS